MPSREQDAPAPEASAGVAIYKKPKHLGGGWRQTWGPGSGASLEGPESRRRSLALDARRRSGFTAAVRGEAAPPSPAGPTGISETGCGVHRPVAGRPGSSAVSLLTPWSSHQQLQEAPEGTVSARPGAQGHACAGPRPEARGHRERSGCRSSVSRYSLEWLPAQGAPSPPHAHPIPRGLGCWLEGRHLESPNQRRGI